MVEKPRSSLHCSTYPLEDLTVHSTVQHTLHVHAYTTLQTFTSAEGALPQQNGFPFKFMAYLLTLGLTLIRYEQASPVMNLYVFSKLNGPF